jgi:hypothetical protein
MHIQCTVTDENPPPQRSTISPLSHNSITFQTKKVSSISKATNNYMASSLKYGNTSLFLNIPFFMALVLNYQYAKLLVESPFNILYFTLGVSLT